MLVLICRAVNEVRCSQWGLFHLYFCQLRRSNCAIGHRAISLAPPFRRQPLRRRAVSAPASKESMKEFLHQCATNRTAENFLQ
uniref:Secreted protein n=1 Tax=Romanomermis culicivorax TaxID=13658 RepID=A0A915I6N8_ROMCU